MFIRNCLTERKHLTVVYPTDTIRQVLEKMDGLLSLPCVTEEDSFLGLISKRTIFEAFQTASSEGVNYQDFLSLPASDCMNASCTPLHLDAYFEETIEIITQHPFVPIVESGKLLGIVKRSDIQHALSVAFATNVESDRLVLGLAEMEGALERLFNVTHRLSLNVITAVPFDAGRHPLNRRLILKVEKSSKFEALKEQLERAGFLIISDR